MADFFEKIAIEVPCPGCNGSYVVSLEQIRLGQMMMNDGCQVQHFADCLPASVAHLIQPSVLAEFENVIQVLESAATKAGSRLVMLEVAGH